MKHTEVREKMATLLEELPEVVGGCEQYMKIYPGKKSLMICINEIYMAVLLALEHMIDWYKQPSRSQYLCDICYIQHDSQRHMTKTTPRPINLKTANISSQHAWLKASSKMSPSANRSIYTF